MRLTTNGSGHFFVNFLQNVGPNDPNDTPLERYRRDATFSCRTLPLIHYGLRAVLKLQKRGNSVFRDKQNRRVHYIGQKSALLQTEERTASDSQSNLMIYFVGRRFFSEEFCCLFSNFFFE